MMKKVFVCAMLMVAMVQFLVEPGQATIDCADVDRSLIQCMPYLTGGAAQPAAGCCAGVKQLTVIASTTPDKRAACNCVKQAATHYQNIKDDAATGLPTKCGVPLSFPISRNIDCNSIN